MLSSFTSTTKVSQAANESQEQAQETQAAFSKTAALLARKNVITGTMLWTASCWRRKALVMAAFSVGGWKGSFREDPQDRYRSSFPRRP